MFTGPHTHLGVSRAQRVQIKSSRAMGWERFASWYYHLPVWLQHAACTMHGWRLARTRYSDTFHQHLDFLKTSEWWSASDIAAYQDAQLRALIVHAYTHVPYYRQVMQARGLQPSDIQGRADLPKLPVLTKEDVRTHREALLADTASRHQLRTHKTSGTTGKALHLYKTPEAIALQWAVWWRHRARFGLSFGDPHVTFTGKPLVDPESTKPPYWRWNYATQQAYIPMQQLVASRISSIAAFLSAQDFAFYSGQPSIISELCSHVQELGLTIAQPPRVVTTGSENLQPHQRAIIQTVTGAIVTDQYGTVEGCGNASACGEGVYHEDFEFGIIECESTGRAPGRLLCTGFACPEFPLIRYEIGDLATPAPDDYACSCGRHSRVFASIDGRIEDAIVTPEGRRITRCSYIFKDTTAIKEAQLVQERAGAVTVRIVQRPVYDVATEAHLRNKIAQFLSPRLEVTFEYVDTIPRESNGKLRAVKSAL